MNQPMKRSLRHYLPNIERLYLSGWTLQRIAIKYGVTRERVRQLVRDCDWYNDESLHAFKRMPEGAECVLDGCNERRANSATGYCIKHYERWRRHGDPEIVLTGSNVGRACVDCESAPAVSLLRCQTCYQRHRYRTDPGWRERQKQSSSKWARNKLATDPEYRARVNAYHNEWRKKRAEQAKST